MILYIRHINISAFPSLMPSDTADYVKRFSTWNNTALITQCINQYKLMSNPSYEAVDSLALSLLFEAIQSKSLEERAIFEKELDCTLKTRHAYAIAQNDFNEQELLEQFSKHYAACIARVPTCSIYTLTLTPMERIGLELLYLQKDIPKEPPPIFRKY